MRRTNWFDGLLVFALSCAFLWLLPDCFQVADEGLVADTAERIYRGEILYRDIFAYWNPGGFWLCAAVFHVAGVSVASLRISLLLFGAAAAVGVWHLARDHCGRPLAILAGLAAPLVCYPIWWMASPHWYSAFAAVAAAAALRRCIGTQRASAAVLATGMLCGVTFAVLQPVGVFLFAAIGACLAWDGMWILSLAAAMRRIALFILGALLPVAATYAYFAAHDALGAMVYDTFLWNFEHYRPMLRSAYGGVHPLLASDPPFHVTRWALMVLPPSVYALALGLTGSRYVRRAVTHQDRRLFALASVGAGLLGSNYYYPDVIHLAFAAPLAFAVLDGLAARFGALDRRRGLATGCAVLLLAFVGFAGISSLQRERSRCSAELSTPRGTIAVDPVSLRELEGVVSYLNKHLSEGESFYVYPAGPGYNFLMGRPNPSPYVMGWPHIPGYLTEEQLAELVSALDRSQVKFVVVLLLFGRSALADSDGPLERYIRDHFRVAKRFRLTLIMERDGQRTRSRPESPPPEQNKRGVAPRSP